MKKNKYAFASLLVICGIAPALASDCTGAECDFMEMMYADTGTRYAPAPMGYTYSEPVGYVAPTPVAQYQQPTEYIYATQIPMRSVKTLTIKPVPEDTRPAVWDGTVRGKQVRYTNDKTVDWRDGVPIWDDSIAHYRRKDFSDWFLEPSPEIYLREVDAPSQQRYQAQATYQTYPAYPAVQSYQTDPAIALYNQNMADAAATRARIDELLEPQRPQFNFWADEGCNDEVAVAPAVVSHPVYAPAPKYTAQDLTQVVSYTFGRSDGCPFDSETECEIWRRKPIIRETVSPRSPVIRADSLNAFVYVADRNPSITANDPISAPLLDRYKMLMRSANACCTDGLVYSLKRAGASDGLIYKFMSDDANFYGFGSRCLMMTDEELDSKYPNTATAAVAADVRNGCLCRGRQWFAAMLAPFQQVYEAAPDFAEQKFFYTYTDGLGRKTMVSVNNDVRNVLRQLELCP
ncbi:MAG: hypothetical protein J6Y49_00900 [Alphaproteobacteria bacterium]|nr:hypothetical protein [Alphaproteobacteria bacterium]